jgi:O-antigen/teichoic acid export membrane protein
MPRLNVATFLYPNYGSHYDPLVVFLVLAPMTAAIVVLYGPTIQAFGHGR